MGVTEDKTLGGRERDMWMRTKASNTKYKYAKLSCLILWGETHDKVIHLA